MNPPTSALDTATIDINGVPFELVLIPAGTFLMGSLPEDDDLEGEGPQHEVTVPAFWMGTYPITQAQWRAVAASLPLVNQQLKPEPAHFRGDQRPVEQITWYEAMEFTERLAVHIGQVFTLPSESQWEYACRAGTNTRYHFGDTITPELANYGCHYQGTTAVGTFPPNAFGLYDMHGNVSEWCLDHSHRYKDAPTDGSPYIDPNARDSTAREARGGCFSFIEYLCRSAARGVAAGNQSANVIGLRVVMAI